MLVIFISVAHGPIGLLRNKIILSILIIPIRWTFYRFRGVVTALNLKYYCILSQNVVHAHNLAVWGTCVHWKILPITATRM